MLATNIGARVLGSRGMIPKVQDADGYSSCPQQFLLDGVLGPLLGDAELSSVDGFWGDSFTVTKLASHRLSMAPGVGFCRVTPANTDMPSYQLLHNPSDFEIEVDPCADTNWSRQDLIAVRPKEVQVLEYRDVKQIDTVPMTVIPTNSPVRARPGWDQALYYFKGSEVDGTPTGPALPAGFVRVADVLVDGENGGLVTVTDQRTKLMRFADLETRYRRTTLTINGSALSVIPNYLDAWSYDTLTGQWFSNVVSGVTTAAGLLHIPVRAGDIIRRISVVGRRTQGTLAVAVQRVVGESIAFEASLPISSGTGVQSNSWSGSLTMGSGDVLQATLSIDNDGMADAVRFTRIEVEIDEPLY